MAPGGFFGDGCLHAGAPPCESIGMERNMKVSRVAAVWRLMCATLAFAVLGACGVNPEKEGLASEGAVAPEEEASVSQMLVDPYADAVAAGGVIAVLNPENAVGVPNGQTASFLAALGGSLVLDMGAGEEGN